MEKSHSYGVTAGALLESPLFPISMHITRHGLQLDSYTSELTLITRLTFKTIL